MTEPERFLLDDFGRSDGVSAIGTRWRGFTDRVMGGLSDMQADVVDTGKGKALRMTGRVRLENNGGFIQVRLPLAGDRDSFDASTYTGFEVTARGRPGAWFLHLRTPECSRPWQYYRVPLPVSSEWSTLTVEFDAFEGKSIPGRPDPSRLSSIAIAAYGEAFDAEIEIARVALVRTASA